MGWDKKNKDVRNNKTRRGYVHISLLNAKTWYRNTEKNSCSGTAITIKKLFLKKWRYFSESANGSWHPQHREIETKGSWPFLLQEPVIMSCPILSWSQVLVQAVQVLSVLVCTQLAGVRGNLVSLGYKAAHVDEEPVAGDAGSHEVVIQVTVNVQLLSCNLQRESANRSQSNLRR